MREGSVYGFWVVGVEERSIGVEKPPIVRSSGDVSLHLDTRD